MSRSTSPQQPPLLRRRSGDAACHITEECERLFCETLKSVFLVEKDTDLENSLVMDMHNINIKSTDAEGERNGAEGIAMSKANVTPSRPIPLQQQQFSTHQQANTTMLRHGQMTPTPSPGALTYPHPGGLIRDYVEVWDYVAGVGFKGFVAAGKGSDESQSLVIFFDKQVVGVDLKPGLMALLELAAHERFDCGQLVIALDRTINKPDLTDLMRDLGWVGFELTKLDALASGAEDCVSQKWLFLGMEI